LQAALSTACQHEIAHCYNVTYQVLVTIGPSRSMASWTSKPSSYLQADRSRLTGRDVVIAI
jgi:hypothetical protein